jgi:hypothetical protein
MILLSLGSKQSLHILEQNLLSSKQNNEFLILADAILTVYITIYHIYFSHLNFTRFGLQQDFLMSESNRGPSLWYNIFQYITNHQNEFFSKIVGMSDNTPENVTINVKLSSTEGLKGQ